MNDQLIQDLRSTKEAILARGWCQGTMENVAGEVCIAGGIILGVTGNQTKIISIPEELHPDWPRIKAVGEIISEKIEYHFDHLPNWNDNIAKDMNEVISVVDDCILDLTQEAEVEIDERELVAA